MPSCSRLRFVESDPRLETSREPRGTLVLLHAFPLSARMWEPQHALAAAGWRVVMPHFRGFDCATPDGAEPESLDDYAEDVADLIETLGVGRAVIGGVSMGGYVALALYKRAPALFRGLILADTRAEADSADARANRARMIELARTGGSEAIADDMVPKLLGETTLRTRPAVVAAVRSLAVATRPGVIQAALRAMMTRDDSTLLLPSIAVPTLVIVGDEDTITPPALSSAMSARIPSAELVILPHAGHLSNIEQPQAFNAAVARYLDRL